MLRRGVVGRQDLGGSSVRGRGSSQGADNRLLRRRRLCPQRLSDSSSPVGTSSSSHYLGLQQTRCYLGSSATRRDNGSRVVMRSPSLPSKPPKGVPKASLGSSSVPPIFTADRVQAAALRFPLWMALVYGAFVCDETSPIAVISVRGPSMLPTMAADQTDLWLVVRYPRLWQPHSVLVPQLDVGDLVGVQVPFRPLLPEGGSGSVLEGGRRAAVVSCKRVVGVEGDVVMRYGQFAPLFASQDPEGYGIAWPDPADPRDVEVHHRDLDPSTPWDADRDPRRPRDPHRTLVVPPGHVWVEGDCPALAVDSRHYGPVPVDAVRGKVMAKLWPPWDRPEMNDLHFRRRPHPIPLDDGTLQRYNVHQIKQRVPRARSGDV